MQSSLPAGWLAFTGRESNPLDHNKRFQITHPPFLDLSWRYRDELPPPHLQFLEAAMRIAYRGRGCMGTGSTDRWRGGPAPRGWRIARQAAGDAPAPVGAPEAAGRPDRASSRLPRWIAGRSEPIEPRRGRRPQHPADHRRRHHSRRLATERLNLAGLGLLIPAANSRRHACSSEGGLAMTPPSSFPAAGRSAS